MDRIRLLKNAKTSVGRIQHTTKSFANPILCEVAHGIVVGGETYGPYQVLG